jgi:hypothetical protein
MSLVPFLAQAFAPWHDLYGDSKAVAIAVSATHLLALLFGGGFAVAADRATLRTEFEDVRTRRRALEELAAVHRPVLTALAVLFLSGCALAAADVETFAASPFFAAKLLLVALLLANGAVLARTEAALRRRGADIGPTADRLWRRLRATARLSMGLWAATLLAGTVLVGSA